MKKRYSFLIIIGVLVISLTTSCKADLSGEQIIENIFTAYKENGPQSFKLEIIEEDKDIVIKEYDIYSDGNRIKLESDNIVSVYDKKETRKYDSELDGIVEIPSISGLLNLPNFPSRLILSNTEIVEEELEEIKNNYKINYIGKENIHDNKSYHIELVNKKDGDSHNIWVDGNRWVVIKYTINKGNNKISINKKNFKYNLELDDTVFALEDNSNELLADIEQDQIHMDKTDNSNNMIFYSIDELDTDPLRIKEGLDFNFNRAEIDPEESDIIHMYYEGIDGEFKFTQISKNNLEYKNILEHMIKFETFDDTFVSSNRQIYLLEEENKKYYIDTDKYIYILNIMDTDMSVENINIFLESLI